MLYNKINRKSLNVYLTQNYHKLIFLDLKELELIYCKKYYIDNEFWKIHEFYYS